MYVSFAAMQVLVGVIGGLLITDPRPGADSEIPDLVFVGGIVAIAVASYLFVTTQVRKQLAGAAREGSLLGTYRSAFFLGMAFTTGTAVTGWIVSFNTYEPLFTALAIAASLPLSIWLAPTASHLRQIDEDARTNGATTSLREALYAPPES
jgi:MFS family permease